MDPMSAGQRSTTATSARRHSAREQAGSSSTWSRLGLRFGVVLTAAVSTACLYGWIVNLQARGRSAAALNMSAMGMTDVAKYWSFPILEASGLVGLVLTYVSVVLGLQQSGRLVRRSPAIYRLLNRFHRQTSLTVIGLVFVHMYATVLDAMGNTWETVLIPGGAAATGWPEATWGFNIGIFAVYTLLLTAPTFYIRHRIGVRRWRFLHRFVLVFYVLSVWHTLILGLDVSYYSWVRPAVWLAQVPLLTMLIRRVLQSAHANIASPQRAWAGVTAARYMVVAALLAAAVAAVLIVVTGHSNVIATV
jgi:predicted ferric reductase